MVPDEEHLVHDVADDPIADLEQAVAVA